MLFYVLLMIGSVTVAFTVLAGLKKLSGFLTLFDLSSKELPWQRFSRPQGQMGFVRIPSKKPAPAVGKDAVKKPWGW